MNNIKYCIYVPKVSDTFEVYYKELIVLTIENEQVIGARQYDYSGKSQVMPSSELPYVGKSSFRNKHFDSIDTLDLKIYEHNTIDRDFWTFNTSQEAFLAKMKLLKNNHEYFDKTQANHKKYFNQKIPENIGEIFDKLKNKYPEYFI